MSNHEKKVVGVWMDHQHAFVISTSNRAKSGEYEVIHKINRDGHNDDNFKNERVELSKDTQELKKYFKSIAAEIIHDDAIFIFGPGKAQEEFKNMLKEDHHFDSKDIQLGSSDKITNNQMIAKVKDHFDGE